MKDSPGRDLHPDQMQARDSVDGIRDDDSRLGAADMARKSSSN